MVAQKYLYCNSAHKYETEFFIYGESLGRRRCSFFHGEIYDTSQSNLVVDATSLSALMKYLRNYLLRFGS